MDALARRRNSAFASPGARVCRPARCFTGPRAERVGSGAPGRLSGRGPSRRRTDARGRILSGAGARFRLRVLRRVPPVCSRLRRHEWTEIGRCASRGAPRPTSRRHCPARRLRRPTHPVHEVRPAASGELRGHVAPQICLARAHSACRCGASRRAGSLARRRKRENRTEPRPNSRAGNSRGGRMRARRHEPSFVDRSSVSGAVACVFVDDPHAVGGRDRARRQSPSPDALRR